LYQVLRGVDQQAVFAQILTGFEMARIDPRWVGFNLVMPEDALIPMRDFKLHMQMIDFLHKLYPEVRITLHAGELAEGLVPPEGLRFHIRESITRGHALRIGHGTDIVHEDNAEDLMREMAAKGILVEVALSSSDVILGIRGKNHPLRTYLRYGVPIALATDDEGVARSNMTLEFRKAVQEQGLDYRTLKRMVRNSISYSFAEDSLKSRLSRELEESFARFESNDLHK
jgi:adenosine deaminase